MSLPRAIIPFHHARFLLQPQFKDFKLRFSKQYAYPFTLSRFAEVDYLTKYNIDAPPYQTRTDTLWWSAVARKNVLNKRVLRSWASRKVRIAFVESLRKKGYASDGSPITGSKNQSPLAGCAYFDPTEAILKTTVEELAKQTDIAVDKIIEAQSANSSLGRKGQKTLSPKSKGQNLAKPGSSKTRGTKPRPQI
jgi:hypothetical protein